jgi:hypothetical protein
MLRQQSLQIKVSSCPTALSPVALPEARLIETDLCDTDEVVWDGHLLLEP